MRSPIGGFFVSTKNMRHSRRLAKISDAAELASCSVVTIRRRIADGSLPAYRLGPRLLRVDLDELEAALRRVPTARGGAA